MRFLRAFAFVAIALSLTGCLIQQDPPTPQVSTAVQYSGLISMQEMRVVNKGGAAVLAGFSKMDSSPAPARALALEESMPLVDERALRRVAAAPWSQFGFLDPTRVDRGGQCRKSIVDRLAPPKQIDLPPQVTIGKLVFGADHQTAFTSLEEGTDHTYFLPLNPPVPAGSYVMHADGNKQLTIPAFEVAFAMPEPLSNVRLNGADIDRPGIVIDRSQPLRLEWDALSIPNDHSAIGFQLISETVTTRHILTCVGLESEVVSVDADGQPSWTIDPSWLSDLFDGDGTQVYLTRELLAGGDLGNLHLDIENIRKWMAVAIVR